MNYCIISGSNRNNSQSSKVSRYCKQVLEAKGEQVSLLDLHEMNLPLWTEAMWNPESEQSQNWQTYAKQLQAADALIIVAAEWAGAIPPSLRNILTHISFKETAHKPALLVGVTSSRTNGAYPISEMRAYSAKNNALVYIPDHVIVRNVESVLNDDSTDDEWIKNRIDFSIDNLILYAKHLKALRDEAKFDFDNYSFGM